MQEKLEKWKCVQKYFQSTIYLFCFFSVKVEKDSPLVLDLRLTPLKAGELSIHGIEYSLKAVFPQSESTDYTIKGKQPLIVQGPRLNSTKETKCSKTPLYMKDSRLTCKVVSKQPRLQLGTFSIPDTMYQVKSFYIIPVLSCLNYKSLSLFWTV